MENEKDCCKLDKKDKGYLKGILYGLIPHAGCIAFIIFAVLGVTAASTFVRPLLINKYFFYILIALSVLFATISAFFYLKKHNGLNKHSIKNHKKYLATLYGTTVIINLLLFFIIFPYLTNAMPLNQQNNIINMNSLAETKTISLSVNIPCSGHAALVTQELYQLNGITNVKFVFPDIFEITYDTKKTTKEEILNQKIFKDFPATEKV